MSDTHGRWRSMLKDAPHNDYCNADLIEELHDALVSETSAEYREQLRQKDEQIRALADVLEAHNNRLTTTYASEPGCHEIILGNYERQKMREALRLAGRTV